LNQVNKRDLARYLKTVRLLCISVFSPERVEKIASEATPSNRCRQMMLKLMTTSHPKAFIVLRKALMNKSQHLVDAIDTKLQQQQDQHGSSPAAATAATAITAENGYSF
jgi:hypothetical protein